MSERFVLDASAILCLLKGEPGADRVMEALPRSSVSAVNISEVYAKLADAGGSEQKILSAIGVLHFRIEPFDDSLARLAGLLRPTTRVLGLSLGDRVCLALAQQRDAVALTTDRNWAKLPSDLSIAVEIIR